MDASVGRSLETSALLSVDQEQRLAKHLGKNVDQLRVDLQTTDGLDGVLKAIEKNPLDPPDEAIVKTLEQRVNARKETGEAKEGFFKRAGKWLWRNKMPIILTTLGILGIRFGKDIAQWGVKKGGEIVTGAVKKAVEPIQEQFDALKAKYDATMGKMKGLEDAAKEKMKRSEPEVLPTGIPDPMKKVESSPAAPSTTVAPKETPKESAPAAPKPPEPLKDEKPAKGADD